MFHIMLKNTKQFKRCYQSVLLILRLKVSNTFFKNDKTKVNYCVRSSPEGELGKYIFKTMCVFSPFAKDPLPRAIPLIPSAIIETDRQIFSVRYISTVEPV